jgi:hypothetical protein
MVKQEIIKEIILENRNGGNETSCDSEKYKA